jgi:phosphohistidine phosphatase
VSSEVYLVRHAEAGAGVSGKDVDRKLTERGRAGFERLLASLGHSLIVTRVLSSPFLRARETAEMLGLAAGAPVEPSDDLASGHASGREMLALARQAGPGSALVGHNPEIAEAIALVSGSPAPVPPGTIAALDLSRPRPRLLWLRSP